MELFHQWINIASNWLNVIGALIAIWGILISLTQFLAKELFDRKKAAEKNQEIRIKLGSYLVLSLEFFIASDIVRTVTTTPTWDSIGMLGAIVIIRTILSFFLTRDISKR